MLVQQAVTRNLKDFFCLLSAVFRPLSSVFAFSLLSFILCLAPLASVASAATVTLGWESSSEPDLEGYVVYRNTGLSGPPYEYSDFLPEDEFDATYQSSVLFQKIRLKYYKIIADILKISCRIVQGTKV